MHIVFLREAGIIVRVGSNKTGYWKINIYNYGTAHYVGAFLFGNATKRPNDQSPKQPNIKCPFRNSIVGQSREMVFAVTKLQHEVT